MTETSQVKMECLMRVGKLSANSIKHERNIIKRLMGGKAKACLLLHANYFRYMADLRTIIPYSTYTIKE